LSLQGFINFHRIKNPASFPEAGSRDNPGFSEFKEPGFGNSEPLGFLVKTVLWPTVRR
jgi:hypothetical protein